MLRDPARLRELEVFCLAVAEGSFSAAARACGLTPSAVSKAVTRLEQRLGVRLTVRSPRGFALTAEGRQLHRNALRLLEDLDTTEREASSGGRPVGRVTLTTSASYAHHQLYPSLGPLLDRRPDLSITVLQTDQVVDMATGQADIAVRAGPMPDSRLIARHLGKTRHRMVASLAWVSTHGIPATPQDVPTACRLDLAYARATPSWSGDGARLRASDGEGLRHMTLAGLGVALLPAFVVRDDLAAGRLIDLHPDAAPIRVEPFYAVWQGGGPLPARIRVVLDHLATHGRVDSTRLTPLEAAWTS